MPHFYNDKSILKSDYKSRLLLVTWTGFAINLGLMIFKFVAGFLGHSQAIVADAVHSFSDLATDLAIIIGVTFWTAPPDETHPHGHRRIETVITFFMGVLLAMVAFGIIYNSIKTLHEPHASPPGIIALIAGITSIVLKEALYRWTVYVGKKIKSSAVVANAWHHRSDAFSSIPATLTIGGAIFLKGWYFLDHIGAIVVSMFILQASWKILYPAYRQIIDCGASDEEIELIKNITKNTSGILSVHHIRTRRLGAGIQADLHIQVDGNLTVDEGHRISENVKENLIAQGPDIIDAIIHLEPEGDPCESFIAEKNDKEK